VMTSMVSFVRSPHTAEHQSYIADEHCQKYILSNSSSVTAMVLPTEDYNFMLVHV
jgi:hypothetical protein